jgi:hypothetical protein
VPHPFRVRYEMGGKPRTLARRVIASSEAGPIPNKRIKPAQTSFADNYDPAAQNDRMPNLRQIDLIHRSLDPGCQGCAPLVAIWIEWRGSFSVSAFARLFFRARLRRHHPGHAVIDHKLSVVLAGMLDKAPRKIGKSVLLVGERIDA